MARRRHYSKAPITEAVIDIRVRLPETARLSDLEAVQEPHRSDYPGKESRSLARGRFEVGRQVSASASSEPIGFLFKSEDEKRIFQAQRDGFTMSRLAPYETWEPFREEARRLWTTYRVRLQPEAIVRLAVRYINRLDLPMPVGELKDYLRTVPEVSPELPQLLSGLFMQLTVPQDDLRGTLLLTEALIEPSRPDVVSVVLDIDLFRTEELPSDDGGIWELFELLHDRKNDVFEACITERTRELIASCPH